MAFLRREGRRLLTLSETPAALLALPRCLSSVTGQSNSGRSSQDAEQPAQQPGQAPPFTPPPVMPADRQEHKHWLDRYFPGVRLWLEERNRHWWIKGMVEGRCK
jgi:hypothetical protein